MGSHGLKKVDLLRGVSGLDGGSGAFELVGLLHFESREAMEGALAAAGAAVMSDIPYFTNVQPVVQISEPL